MFVEFKLNGMLGAVEIDGRSVIIGGALISPGRIIGAGRHCKHELGGEVVDPQGAAVIYIDVKDIVAGIRWLNRAGPPHLVIVRVNPVGRRINVGGSPVEVNCGIDARHQKVGEIILSQRRAADVQPCAVIAKIVPSQAGAVVCRARMGGTGVGRGNRRCSCIG